MIVAGFVFMHKPGVTRVGGGAGFYIGEHLNYKEHLI